MSKDANGPTNGGSKFKTNSGIFEVKERENECKIPPDEYATISLPENENDYITIPLVPDREIEHEM